MNRSGNAIRRRYSVLFCRAAGHSPDRPKRPLTTGERVHAAQTNTAYGRRGGRFHSRRAGDRPRRDLPGVTATEIRIGNTMPYSGPASAYGTIGKAMAAMFRMANDQGGFAGRKVNFISYDDGYSPPKTVEQTRRLIEEDKVAALFAPLGTPTNSAIVRYVNQKKVPHLFLATGADKWGDYKEHPVDDRLAAELRHGVPGLCQVHPRPEARREDRHPVSERRFRKRLPARRAGRAEG